MGVAVRVGDGVSVREGVADNEGVSVIDGVKDEVKVGGTMVVAVGLGVTPSWARSVETASPGLTGVISWSEQN